MRQSIQKKLEAVVLRYEELAVLLSEASIIAEQEKFTAYSKEYAQLQPIVECFQAYEQTQTDLQQAELMLAEDDAELRELAQEELTSSKEKIIDLENELQVLLLPQDPSDERNIFLEVRAGTGGNEAAIFAGDLFRMYSRYAEKQGWRVTLISESLGDHGGYKEIVAKISGQQVYSKLKFESGAHRVQRVPETESQGRVHTSACTVAILPELDEVEEVEVNSQDLRIDSFRSSGAGGQHVNTTDSAIRITHLPTGLVVECQDERSQHKNKAKAMTLLKTKLLVQEREKQHAEMSEKRRNLVGSGDRSERIRTYNFPQGRLTDHRINLTLYKLADIIEGDLEPVISALTSEHQADLLLALEDEN